MARAEFFWNLIANRYSKQAIADEAAYKIKLEKTQKLFTPETTVLEFGCGTGSTALIHAPFVKKITAIDYSKKMIEIANGKAKEAGVKNVEFIKATLFDIPNAPNSYDIILGLNILHLLPNYQDTIQRTYELLKPGGYFITSTVCLGDLPRLEKYIIPVISAFRVIPYVKILRLSEFEKDLTAVGFKLIEASHPGKDKGAVFTIAQKI